MNNLELDNMKNRITENLQKAFDNGLEENKLLIAEASADLEELQEKVYGTSPATVASLIKDLYELASATNITSKETGNSITVDDFQEMIYLKVELLAEMLGIDLEN
ncbi:hypothetical protein M2139_001728 [Enterococcus sp. PF1-24]|uniref:hypothetical protein n=1 Tax=unclassified Enterococcus TaxID=2608891 RepID=UPI0024745F80|nr:MULTISPECIES: hypothetical protein [unclassified Enterococcus]MDH6364696.1 hypothetical protein [Enterococcus sp. PFB1-1]MDH6401828.1 hypothetical protein [Enterococcus sp. PF1-24]